MTDIKVYVLFDQADNSIVIRLKDSLEKEFGSRLPVSDRPEIDLREGLTNLPNLCDMSDLSQVLVILPGRSFTVEEQTKIKAFRQSFPNRDVRLVPVAIGPGRNVPPPPLDDLVSFKDLDLGDQDQIQHLATLTLNLLCLRVASAHRSVFISYRLKDGQHWATKISEGLEARGYQIWLDENLDRDGQSLVTVGSPAQQTIEQAILQHGFVLVIDTSQAPFSHWVHEEVNMSIQHMLPMLPVVVEDPVGGDPKIEQVPRLGGRFRALRELQHEVRLTITDLDAAFHATGDHYNAMEGTFFDRLELEMNQRLLEHLRSRRRLIREAQRRFEALRFQWEPVSDSHLLYRATSDLDGDISPSLVFRVLVQCAPYSALLDDHVGNLCAFFRQREEPHQYCVLIHQTASCPADKRRLVSMRGGHVILLQPDEIDNLPFLIQLASGGAV